MVFIRIMVLFIRSDTFLWSNPITKFFLPNAIATISLRPVPDRCSIKSQIVWSSRTFEVSAEILSPFDFANPNME